MHYISPQRHVFVAMVPDGTWMCISGEATVATSYMLMMYIERMTEPWLTFARATMNFLNDQRVMMFAFQSTMVTSSLYS